MEEDWNCHDFDVLGTSAQSRIIVFRTPPGKTSFGSVRVLEDRHRGVAKLWDIITSRDLPAEEVFMGLIPARYACILLGVELQIFLIFD